MTKLETAARALFGEAWQSALARAVRVNDRTVRRWHGGQSPVPVGIWPELKEMLRLKATECRALARSIRP